MPHHTAVRNHGLTKSRPHEITASPITNLLTSAPEGAARQEAMAGKDLETKNPLARPPGEKVPPAGKRAATKRAGKRSTCLRKSVRSRQSRWTEQRDCAFLACWSVRFRFCRRRSAGCTSTRVLAQPETASASSNPSRIIVRPVTYRARRGLVSHANHMRILPGQFSRISFSRSSPQVLPPFRLPS
jgi:hypothetical protein